MGGVIDFSYGGAFEYLPMHQLLKWFEAGDEGKLKYHFSNRVVLLGSVLPFIDRHHVAVDLAAWEPVNRYVPGVLLDAQVIHNLLHDGLLQVASPLHIMVLTGFTSLLWWTGRRPIPGVVSLAGFSPLCLGYSFYVLQQGKYWPMAVPVVVAASAIITRMVFEAFLVYMEKRLLRSSFGRYVSPNVLNAIVAGDIRPGPGGIRQRVCILISDIRSFTTRCEASPRKSTAGLYSLPRKRAARGCQSFHRTFVVSANRCSDHR